MPIVWRDGFECYTPFAIDNIEGWTAIDGEGGTTWGANDVDFTNESYAGAGIIWNSNEADNLGNDISGYNAYEGNQGLYFFASGANSTPFPNDDWRVNYWGLQNIKIYLECHFAYFLFKYSLQKSKNL